ncbi:LOW QUALITY PROTEIN: CD226 antigen [Sylvia borin]
MDRETERQRPKSCLSDGVTVRCAAAAAVVSLVKWSELHGFSGLSVWKKAVIIQTSWMKLNVTHKKNTAVLHPIYGIHTKEKFNRRIYFENRGSLSSIKSTLEDHGLHYTDIFSIVTNPDGILKKVIEITQSDAFEVSGKQNNFMFTKPEGNVAFTCPCKMGDSVQQAMWERIKADWADIVILCNSSGKQSLSSDFKGCTPMDCSDQENPSTVFQSITASDFALYFHVAAGRNKYMMSFPVAGK